VESLTQCSSSALLPTALFSGGEKVPKADEGALALAKQWTIFMNGRWKLMKTLNFSARTAPSSAFGTFSPARNRGEEGLSTGYRVPTIPVSL
jgi:hypothetical protein